ncbi:MAG: hypothetical protein NVS2B16_21250 [Chloroflexota bacterium]
MSFYALYHDEAAPGAAGIGSMAASTSPEKKTPETHVPRATLEATQFLDMVPGAREAIQQRLDDDPEYRRWLQQFGKGILQAVE